MNKTYKSIFNHITQSWVAVSETTNAKGKKASGGLLASGLLAIGLLASPVAFAEQGVSGGTSSNATSTAISACTGTTQATATNQYSIAIGCSAATSANNSISIGNGAGIGFGGAEDLSAIAIGHSSSSYAYSVALGDSANADQVAYTPGKGGIAIGYKAWTDNLTTSGVAIGNNAAVKSEDSSVINGAIAIGESASASKSNSVALGSNATTATKATKEVSATLNNLTYGTFAGQVTDTGMQVSVGKAGAERQIKNVGSGAISATSTDGINGSQLYATNSVLGNLANTTKNILGGNAALNPNGSLTMTNIGGTGKNNINDAIAAVETTVTQGTNMVVTPTTNANASTNYQVATSLTPTITSVSQVVRPSTTMVSTWVVTKSPTWQRAQCLQPVPMR